MIRMKDSVSSMRRVLYLSFALVIGSGFVLSSASAKAPQQQSAIKHTNKGLRLYRQKKYAEAAKEFQQAVDINPQSASAHWNLARAMGMLLQGKKACENGVNQSVIIQHLFKACRLKPRLKRKLLRQRSLRSVSNTLAWQRLMGLSPSNTKNVKKILRNVSWYGPASAEGDPIAGIDFRPRGRLLFWLKDKTTELGRKTIEGTWRVQQKRVFVDLKKPYKDKKHFEGEMKQTGELWLPGLPAPFTDDSLLCASKATDKQAP